MKVSENDIKFNFHLIPAEQVAKTVNVCGHKNQRLNSLQNCHLLSFTCQQKCSLRHFKHCQPQQHQEFTEIELRKFMTNKIEHNNKAITIFKKQILREIEIGEEILKSMKDDLMKRIDMLFYGAVKSQNTEVTTQSMDKFLMSELDVLTCHEVFCVFNFRPQISENLNIKISETLDSVKQQILKLSKSIDETRLLITQKMIRSEINLESRKQMMEQETPSLVKYFEKKPSIQKKPETRIEEQKELKNNFLKLRTISSESQKSKIESQRSQKLLKSVESQETKQQKVVQKKSLPNKQKIQQQKQQDNKVASEKVIPNNANQTERKQHVIQNKPMKTTEKDQTKQKSSEIDRKQKQSSKLDQQKDKQTKLLKKCQIFQGKKPQQVVNTTIIDKSINNEKINSEKLQKCQQKLNHKESTNTQTSKTSKIEQLSFFFKKYKETGSLNSMFREEEKNQSTKIIEQKYEKRTVETPINFQSTPNTIKEKQFLPQKQTNPGYEKKSVFQNLKRAAQTLKQKHTIEGRKIIKTGNYFTDTSEQKTETKIAKSIFTNQQKMIPYIQSQKSQGLNVNMQKVIPIQNSTKIQVSDTNLQKKQISEIKEKPIDKELSQKEKISQQPKILKSDQPTINVFSQSNRIEIEKHCDFKNKDFERNKNQLKNQQKQSSSSEMDITKIIADKHINSLPKQTTKQLKPSQKQSFETKKDIIAKDEITGEKKVNQNQCQNPKSLFLRKPNQPGQFQQDQSKSPRKQGSIQDPKQSLQFGGGAQKIIRLKNPVGSRMFGRVSQNTIHDRVLAFERGEQAMKEKKLREQQYSKLSLMGELQNSSNVNSSEPKQQNSISENKILQRKMNFNRQHYESSIPSWMKPKEEQ